MHVCACLGCYGWPKLTAWVGVPANLCEEQMLDHQRVTSHIQSLRRERPGSARPVGGERVEKRSKFWLRGNPYSGTTILVAWAPGPVCILKNREHAVPAVDF